jgi:crotonobetainyl-CoA:carnitine CoA-transferase CaiB-like acyl-CoA transferase
MAATERQGPLKGMRVIDMAHVMAGPTCALMLADMGADVIKLEKADGGDDTRRILPPAIEGEPAAFMMMNRNKRGLVLDLKKPAGKAAFLRLVGTVDALVENYRHDTMQGLGLGYEALRVVNPGLIYCAISGYGRNGPLATHGGFDLIAQGMSGLMSITGEGAGRPPVKVGSPVCDITAGILAAMGICAAYAHKLRTGEGQFVDTSLFEAGIVHTYWQSAIAFATGVAPGPMGSAHPLNAPYQAFRTCDGWITVGAANAKLWSALIEVLGAPELGRDPRFADNAARMANLAALEAELNRRFEIRSSADWLAALEKAGIPSGPVLDVRAMHAHPQTAAREMAPALDHPRAGRVRTIGLPVKFSATPGKVARPAPLFGEHSREVLAEAGFSAAEIESFAAEGVLGSARRG